MQVLTVIIPYSRPTSNFALSCVVLWRWLSSNGFLIKTFKRSLCCQNLDFYLSLSFPKSEICTYAAARGDLELLKRARDCKADWDCWACVRAAQNGHLAVLVWAKEYGAPWPSDGLICAAAAQGGQLRVLKWLRASGVSWDKGSCSYAAEEGHLEVLKWLRENGCPWNWIDCLSHAARNLHSETVKWIKENDGSQN